MKGKLTGTTTSQCMHLSVTLKGTGHKFDNNNNCEIFIVRACLHACSLSVEISNKVRPQSLIYLSYISQFNCGKL